MLLYLTPLIPLSLLLLILLVYTESNDNTDLTKDLFMWNSYEEFSEFCAKIGLCFDNPIGAKKNLNTVRCQQELPSVNLKDTASCVELFGALRF